MSNLGAPGYSATNLFGRGFGSAEIAAFVPTLWPIMGPITSSFGQREDPVLGNGEGEFHTGIDISAANGVPIRATGDGTVITAEMSHGYGREIVVDHGHGVETVYGHMSGFAVIAGQAVVRGQVIGYGVGHGGRTTGSAPARYEFASSNTPVNPRSIWGRRWLTLAAKYQGLQFFSRSKAGPAHKAGLSFCVRLCTQIPKTTGCPALPRPIQNKDFPLLSCIFLVISISPVADIVTVE